MSGTRRILRAFLASPGDLQEERKAIREVVAEFNAFWAPELGYQVELLGWEDTIAGFGRPQHIINSEVDQCELFIGMMWKRWGTPPQRDRTHTSGFQEEFERALARRERAGSPEIALLFKRIPEEYSIDPGEDLKKVISFRERMVQEKILLFHEFSTIREIEYLARKTITAYVIRVKKASAFPKGTDASPKRANVKDRAAEVDGHRASSPLSSEGFEFLQSLLETLSQEGAEEHLTATDIARFRLLANLVTKHGNQEGDLGAHDINLIFVACIRGMKLGTRELRCLARLGFRKYRAENVPLWHWYAALADSILNPAVLSALVGPDEEKVGAINALTALSLDMPANDKVMNRRHVVEMWFSRESSGEVRSAALRYLAKKGTAEDYDVVRAEYDTGQQGTSVKALECMIEIRLRTGQVAAARELVVDSEFKTLNPVVLRPVLASFDGASTSALEKGLRHRNVHVRLEALKVLSRRGAISQEMVERLCEDGEAIVRRAAIAVQLDRGDRLSVAEVKEILVDPENQRTVGLLGIGTEQTGQELFVRYQVEELKKKGVSELTRKVHEGLMYDDEPYFARVEKWFARYGEELRKDIDDRFGRYFDQRIQRMETRFVDYPPGRETIERAKELREFSRKKLTRWGLDILCKKAQAGDVGRIRENVGSGYAGVTKRDVEYMGQHGSWVDIELVAKIDKVNVHSSGWPQGQLGSDEFEVGVAAAIMRIARGHELSEVVRINMPEAVLKTVVERCADARFATIGHDALLYLLDHDSAEVRKAAAKKAVSALPRKRVKKTLEEYAGREKFWYYNVVHWLDVGASMPRAAARRVARGSGD